MKRKSIFSLPKHDWTDYDELKTELQAMAQQGNTQENQSKFREWIDANLERINKLSAIQQQLLVMYAAPIMRKD